MVAQPGLTLRTAFRRLCKDRAESWGESTRRQYERRFQWMEPVADVSLGALTIEQITALLEHVRTHARSQTTAGKDPGEAAARAVAYLLNVIFKHAISRKQTDRNPLDAVDLDQLFKRRGRSAKPIPATSVPVFWSWLQSHAAPGTRDFAVLMLLAGLPRATIAELTVQQIDTEHWLLRIPAIEGRKRSEQEIHHPVPAFIVEHVLRPRLATLRPGQVYLIEAREGRPLVSIKGKLLQGSLKVRAGLTVTEQDLRKTSTVLMLSATMRNSHMTRRLLTVRLQTVSALDPSIDQLRAAQERAVTSWLKLCSQRA